MSNKLEILATPMDDTRYCRFTLGISAMVDGEVNFRSRPSEAFFVQDLFDIDGISQVIVDSNYIICEKSVETPWPVLGKTIGNVLRINHKNNSLEIPAIYKGDGVAKTSETFEARLNEAFLQSKLGKEIQELIELQVQPSLGAHGGSVRIIDFQDGRLFVTFSGGCQGCSQASVTVKDGIEKIISAKFSEVKEVIDITNHESGVNPYFK